MIDRIKQLLDWQQLSPTQFADRIGVGRPVVSHILSERNKPSLEVVQRIIAAFPDLSLAWLLSGSGEMLATAPLAATTTAPGSASASDMVPPVLAGVSVASVAAVPAAPEPTRPVAVSTAPQPAPYQRATPGVAGPARFQAGGAPSVIPESSAARFVAGPARPRPAESVAAQPAASFRSVPPAPAVPVPHTVGVPAPEPVAIDEASAAAAAPLASPPPAPAVPGGAVALAQAMGESLGDPAKSIRRIVLFYTDGSFADFRPE